MVKLGEQYRDEITGFEGTATARSEFLNGCVRVCLEGGDDGKPAEYWFDEQRLDPTSSATTGGAGLGSMVRNGRGALVADSWVGFHTFRHTCATTLFRVGPLLAVFGVRS